MSYTKTNWQDLPNTSTPINATRLNNIENGIANSDGAIDVDEYSNSSTYAIGDYCIYNNKLYRCIVAITTSEAFNSSKWQQTRILDEVGTIDEDLENATKGYQTTQLANELEITDSAGVNGKIKLVGGNTHQDSYTGKNKLQIPSTLARTINGLTFVVNSDGSVTITGTSTANTDFAVEIPEIPVGTYTFSLKTVGTISANSQQQWLLRHNNTDIGLKPVVVSNEINSNIKTITETANRLQIFTTSGRTFNCTIYPQVEEGSSVTEWEKYVGGTPSPNPDYPQKVNNVGSNVNLFDKSDTPINNVNVTKTEINTGVRITLTSALAMRASYMSIKNINILLGKTLTLSAKITPSGNNIGQVVIFWVNKNTKAVVGSNLGVLSSSGSLTFIVPNEIPSDATDLCILFYGNGNQSTGINVGDYVDYTEVKLEEGSQPTGYTPYNRGGIDVKVENKNLFDKNVLLNGFCNASTNTISTQEHADYYRSDYIPVNKNKGNVKISGNTMGYIGGSVGMLGFDKNKNIITSSSTTTMDISNCYYVMLSVPKVNVDTLQLEYGTTASSYIAHAEQNITIPLPTGMELCKIGEYSDKIFHNIPSNPMYNASLTEGGWYKYNKMKKVITNSTTNITKSGTGAYYFNNNIYNGCILPSSNDDVAPIICNQLKADTPDNTWTAGKNNTISALQDNTSNPRFRMNDITTIEALDTHLQSNPLIFYAPLITPTYPQITDTDTIEALYQIEHLLMYQNYTHIYSIDEIAPYLQLDYLYDNQVNNTFGSIIDALEERVHLLEINS